MLPGQEGDLLPNFLTGTGMYYDEMYITTRREIAICLDAIRRLTQIIGKNEQQHQLTSEVFLSQYRAGIIEHSDDFLNWYESCLSLERWQTRLKGYRQIMLM